MSASKKGLGSSSEAAIFAAIQQAEEEAHESDVLEDSSDEESEHGGEDASSDKCKMVDDANEEEYGNFLRSCFCNEEDAYSLLSFNDEDEDQDYHPPSRKDGYDNDDEDEDEDEDDDDGEDDGLVKVAQTELVDLVDGCWQTITGASLTFLDREPPSMVDQSSRGSSKRDYSEFSESEYGNMAVDGNKRLRSKATRRDAQAMGTHVRAPLNTGGSVQAASVQTHDAAKSNNNISGIAGGVTSAATGGMNAPTRNGSRNASSNSLMCGWDASRSHTQAGGTTDEHGVATVDPDAVDGRRSGPRGLLQQLLYQSHGAQQSSGKLPAESIAFADEPEKLAGFGATSVKQQ